MSVTRRVLKSLGDERRSSVARAGIVFAFAAPIAYLVQHLVSRSSDPLAYAHVLVTPFYWRAVTSLWWGGLAAIVAYRVRSERWSRRAGIAAFAVAAVYATLVWVLP